GQPSLQSWLVGCARRCGMAAAPTATAESDHGAGFLATVFAARPRAWLLTRGTEACLSETCRRTASGQAFARITRRRAKHPARQADPPVQGCDPFPRTARSPARQLDRRNPSRPAGSCG